MTTLSVRRSVNYSEPPPVPSEDVCDYCRETLDRKIKQGRGHVDDWAKDNDGAYHWRCIPAAETKQDAGVRRRKNVSVMTGRIGSIHFHRPRYGRDTSRG